MAKILIGLYNGLYEKDKPEILPCWYDGFINGLRKRCNDVFLWQTNRFGAAETSFDEIEKEEIIKFDPDICLSFNNILPSVKDFLFCQTVIVIVDSIRYLSNLNILENRRNLFVGSFQDIDIDILINAGMNRSQVFKMRPYTAIMPDKKIIPDTNISFIGTKFGVSYQSTVGFISQIGQEAVKQYEDCLKYLNDHPLANEAQMVKACNVSNRMVAQCLNAQGMLSLLSSEKRVRVLSAVVDLGLDLYGTRSWLTEYHYNSRLNCAFVDKKVWSVSDNQNVYNHSKIGLNVSHMQAVDGFPWRVLDIMSSNACLVSDYHSGYDKEFTGCYFPVYNDEFEAREICKWLLKDEKARKQIVEGCNQYIAKNYRLDILLQQLTDITGVLV